jgi:uncharacterized UBP type Zn finger protein
MIYLNNSLDCWSWRFIAKKYHCIEPIYLILILLNRDLTHPRSLQDALEMSLQKESIEYTCEKCHCTRAVVTHKFTKLTKVNEQCNCNVMG